MINVARMALLAAAVSALVALPASGASAASFEDIFNNFHNADANGDNQLSLDEYRALQEKQPGMEGPTAQARAKFPVYVNGFEFHYPRHRYYYFPDGSFIDDQGPERFYR